MSDLVAEAPAFVALLAVLCAIPLAVLLLPLGGEDDDEDGGG